MASFEEKISKAKWEIENEKLYIADDDDKIKIYCIKCQTDYHDGTIIICQEDNSIKDLHYIVFNLHDDDRTHFCINCLKFYNHTYETFCHYCRSIYFCYECMTKCKETEECKKIYKELNMEKAQEILGKIDYMHKELAAIGFRRAIPVSVVMNGKEFSI
jgi:hypothetical protein